jgi:hypothetical protein
MNVKYTYDPKYVAARAVYAARGPLSRGAKAAGKKIWRAWKNRQKRRRMAPTAPSVGKSVQDLTSTLETNVTIETLYKDTLIAPSQPTSSNEYNVRDKAIVYYSGFKICRVFELIATQLWVEVHYAIIQWRKDSYQTDTTDMKVGFFRDTSAVTSGESRTSDFDDVIGARTYNHKYACLPMNPNKKYRIITHKRFLLCPRQATAGGMRHCKKIQMWVPVKKRMNFATRDAIQPDTPFDEVWWYTTRTQTDWNAINNPQDFDQLKTWNTNRVYFKG